MGMYEIVSRVSGANLGRYEGETVQDALDAMARDAGCANFEAACEASGDDGSHLVVTPVAKTALRSDARVVVAIYDGTQTALLAVEEESTSWNGDEGVEYSVVTNVYGAEDWRDSSAPSFAFDKNGDLRQHNGERVYGRVIETVDMPADEAEALLRATWPNTDGIFVE